ncbi:MAG: hypothetical protein LQ343_004419 [Gyalolechia ehrenbergii]|nr:MAG: hypothetical protein LQ343_004419 [Gyalolechia ehrenbergii]
MKQLNLKSVVPLLIDWDAVANELQITNGHAARMRYSRFKQQMEGTTSTTRKPRVSGPRKRKEKADGTLKPAKKAKKDNEPQAEDEKSEDTQAMSGVESAAPPVKSEPTEPADLPEPPIKPEQSIEPKPNIKQEPAEPGLNNVTLPNNNKISSGEWPVTRNSPDPLPDFFSTEEELEASAMIDPALTVSAAIDPALFTSAALDPALIASVAIDDKDAKRKIETEPGHCAIGCLTTH